MTRQQIFQYVKENYGTEPEYLWATAPEYAVLRHLDNRKWYAIVMNVSKEQLGLSGGEERIDIIDVKCDPVDGDFLKQIAGILPGYHMNHRNWITILLDGTVSREQTLDLLDVSYRMTMERKQRK